MKEGLLKMEDMLTLFEDLYECCQEAQLTALFPLFERAILGSKLDGSERMELKENQRHTCTKICRIIMTKLTVTHDLQLRGTLLRFVARTLPLTHPSGCNKMSHFNTANVTSIETPLALQTTSTPENSKNDNEIDAAQKDNIASSKSSNEKEALI